MVFVAGIVSIIVFYLVILAVGIWAARKSRGMTNTDDIMVAGRDIGLLVGIFTMTATWVGGGYINGTAEAAFSPKLGLVHCQAPFGYAISLILGGLLFAKPMRELKYVTMLDPFQSKYGERMCGLLFIPALLGEMFWTAAILSALGATLSVIIELDHTISIIISTCIAVLYTVFGGLYSVAYTDVIQLFCIFVGLWVSIPFILTNDAVAPISETWDRWKGHVDASAAGTYTDDFLLLMFGGIPWQVYFQRVLSSKTAFNAQILSFCASFGCILMAIPSIIIGAAGASADWNTTGYPHINGTELNADQGEMVLPLVLYNFTPRAVAIIGLGAISAAVMSSSDSSVLSAASMLARNVVKPIFWKKASEKQVIWVMRGGILVVGSLSCVLAITVQSIYELWFLCSDMVYVILFPQLVCVLYFRFSNTYGSLSGFVIGLLFRITAGEPWLGLHPLIDYPSQLPCKTLFMIISLLTIVLVSYLSDKFIRSHQSRLKYDIFNCYQAISNQVNRAHSIRIVKSPISVDESMKLQDMQSSSMESDKPTCTHSLKDAIPMDEKHMGDDDVVKSLETQSNPNETEASVDYPVTSNLDH